jgi:hypothetical protein
VIRGSVSDQMYATNRTRPSLANPTENPAFLVRTVVDIRKCQQGDVPENSRSGFKRDAMLERFAAAFFSSHSNWD